MKKIDLISSKKYWVETLQAMQQLGYSDYEIATVIADKIVEAINYNQCCKTLNGKEKIDFDSWQEVNYTPVNFGLFKNKETGELDSKKGLLNKYCRFRESF